MHASALLHQIVWLKWLILLLYLGVSILKKMKTFDLNSNFNCIKVRSSVHMPKCEANSAVNNLISDAFLKTFAYLQFS